MKKVLVTGGAGFLGSRVVSDLKSLGFSVISTDRSGQVDVRGDLADPKFTEKLPDIDLLVHLASVQYVSSDLPLFHRANYFSKNNIVAANNLIKRYKNQIDFAVFTSTSMVYSSSSISPINEHAHTGENGIYSKSKLEVEKLFSKLSAPVAVIRPCIIAGPGRGGLFVSLQNALTKFKIRVVPGNGDFLTSVVHVEDVSSLVTLIALKEKMGIFNCAGLDPKSIIDWGQILALNLGIKRNLTLKIPMWIINILAKGTSYRFLAREQVEMLKRNHFLDISAGKEIGWIPRYSTNQILEMTANAYKRKRSAKRIVIK